MAAARPKLTHYCAQFKGGQTVEVLKSHVETALGIPMSDQVRWHMVPAPRGGHAGEGVGAVQWACADAGGGAGTPCHRRCVARGGF